MVVGYPVYADPVVMEITLSWLWVIGVVALLILVGYLFRGRRNDQSSRGPYGSGDQLLPNRIELFRQRRRQHHVGH